MEVLPYSLYSVRKICKSGMFIPVFHTRYLVLGTAVPGIIWYGATGYVMYSYHPGIIYHTGGIIYGTWYILVTAVGTSVVF